MGSGKGGGWRKVKFNRGGVVSYLFTSPPFLLGPAEDDHTSDPGTWQ